MISLDDVEKMKVIFNALTRHNRVSLFIHENPDYDALGSAFAIKELFKTMNIRCEIIGLDLISDAFKSKIFNIKRDKITDEYIKNSIGLILDTANEDRILSQRHKLCKEKYRIDHHPHLENIADFEWVNINYSSTCEMVGWFMIYNMQRLSSKICDYLYAGILTDSGKLMYYPTQKSTYELITYFYDNDFNKQDIQNKIYLKRYDEFKVDRILRNKIKIKKHGFAYIHVNKKLREKLNLDRPNNKVYLLSDIEEIKIWYIIFQDSKNNIWKGSIRSRDYDVSSIAAKFNGGGHMRASGFKLDSKKQIKQLNKEIKKLLLN